ncbi:MAG TPA: zf-HC2 domain-containing protein [Thermoanaerobaculia bacterium]|jgi:hypothetical protein
MSCWRFDVRRNLFRYADGAASPRVVDKVERHLLDCVHCRATVMRLRGARTLLRGLPQLDAPMLNVRALRTRGLAAAKKPVHTWPKRLAADFGIASAFFLVFAVLWAHAASARASRRDWSSFRPIAIAELRDTSDPHVITEGIVAGMVGERDENGSARFKLADPNHRDRFVVCEILDANMRVPKDGTRVRVYGVSRYDSRPEHRWFEIHPVLRIE